MGSAQGPVTSELERARTAPEFGAHTSLAEKLLAVAIRAQNFTGSTGVAIALSDGQEMVCRANWGTSAPEVGARLNTENSFTGLCVRTGEALRCDDAQSDPRVDPQACRALGISGIAVAPVRRKSKVIGVIAAFSDTPNTFTEKHLLILTTLAEVIVELLDDPRPPVPLPAGLDAAPDLAGATVGAQSPPAPQLDKARTASLIREPITAVEDATVAATAPEKSPEMPAAHGSPPDQAAANHVASWPATSEAAALQQQPKTTPPPSRSKTGRPGDASPSRLQLVKQAPSTPEPDFGPELTLSSFEADASPPRRWLLPVAILAIFAVIAFASWLVYSSRHAGPEKQLRAATPAAPQAAPAPTEVPQPEPARLVKPDVVETEPESANPKLKANAVPPPAPSPAKATSALAKPTPAKEPAVEPEDVTIRHSPEPVIEDAGPVRHPSVVPQRPQVPEAPQLAMVAPQLPSDLAKPAASFVAGPVSRLAPARLDRRVEPPYPDAARRMGIAGRVVMKATISKSGAVSSLQWVSGNEIFRDTTIAAVRQWRYKPATLNGQPVESDLEIVLQFSRK